MRYAPPGLCLNDFSVVECADGSYELLHLQGPWTRDFNHFNMETSYGRAISRDLVNWEPAGPSFGVGPTGSFDDLAVWTMHPIPHGDGSVMFYTGVTMRHRDIQSIGIARSDRRDSTGWRRASSTPIVEADARWYRTNEGMGWRDPFVVQDDDGTWVMVICASDASLPLERSGCVAWATSSDLVTWEVHSPLISPGDVDELECPVLERVDGGWILFGSIGQDNRVECWTSDELAGPWTRSSRPWPRGAYAPRAVTAPDGDRVILHTVPRRVGLANDGERCRGMLAQPKRLSIDHGEPLLVWWGGLDAHLQDGDSSTADVRVAEVDIVEGLRISSRSGADASLPTLTIEAGQIVWSQTGAREDLPAGSSKLKVLTVGEYLEVYVDDRFLMAVSSYSGTPTRIDASCGGLPVEVQHRFRSRASERDDVSAVWFGSASRVIG